MKKTVFFLLLIVFGSACTQKGKNDSVLDPLAARNALMDADRAFSKMSEEKGMKNAFIEYIDSNGVLLRPGHMPIVGANAIDYLIQLNDSGYSLRWEPHKAVIAKSGELGYTYGVYALHPGSKDTTLYGTYTSIWKKQNDGKWKFVLDTGNEGLSEE